MIARMDAPIVGRRAEMLEYLGWHVVRVIKEDRPRDIVERVSAALARRGYTASPPDRSLGRGQRNPLP
jgi:hypothetical protein